MFGELLKNVKTNRPMIHSITNYVTANDCANILLACGASPIMADDPEEAVEITSQSDGLNINIGTPSQRTFKSMLIAGKKANELNHPIVLDPVGIGVSELRTNIVSCLLNDVHFSVIRGNASEINALAFGVGSSQGVDAAEFDKSQDEIIEVAKSFSKRYKAVITVTGAVDIVTDGNKVFLIRNGHKMMSSITGTGCQLSALITSFAAANPDRIFESAAAASCAMGICGDVAYKRLSPSDGNATYRNYIIDAVYNLTPQQLNKDADYDLL